MSQDTLSLMDALKEGMSPDDIRQSFETELQNAQIKIAAEEAAKAKAAEKEAKSGNGDGRDGDCSSCKELEECELNGAREDLIYVVLDYLKALGAISKDTEVSKENIKRLIEIIKDAEADYKTRSSLMRMLTWWWV